LRSPSGSWAIYLIKERVEAERALRGVAEDLKYLARVEVAGPPRTMKLPEDAALAKFALAPVRNDELANSDHRVVFNVRTTEEDSFFEINDNVFDPAQIDRKVKLGTAEEWTLFSREVNHPFHIHVNPFELIRTDPMTGKVVERVWRDTYLVRASDPSVVKIRTRFEDFAGKTVLHCHILDHEDQGMMQIIQIEGSPRK
jgi:FtsP/CotA-like multicopper oxidase with cupredoxin domain